MGNVAREGEMQRTTILGYIPIFLLSLAVMPPNFSNRSAIRSMIFWSAAFSPEGWKRYLRANCSLLAFSTSCIAGNRLIGSPLAFQSTTRQNCKRP